MSEKIEKLLLNSEQTAEVLCFPLSTLRQHDSRGLIPKPIRVGKRLFWEFNELKRWIKAGAPPRTKWNSMNCV